MPVLPPNQDLGDLPFQLLRPFFRQAEPSPKDWKSVLILRPCCIGDILQSTALVAALRRALPGIRLGYAVGAWSRPVLENNPHIDQLVDTGTVVGGRKPSPGAFLGLVNRLRRGGWDACFVLERSPLFSLAAWLAGIPDRVGLDNRGRGVALTKRVPLRPRRQEAEAVLDLARAVGLDVSGVTTEFYPSEADRLEVARLMTGNDSQWVVLAPGGGINPGTELTAKRWPAENFGRLATRLARHGYLPLIIGGPQDHEAATVAQQVSEGAALNLCGRLSLSGCGALLQQARLLVANDTGVMHLAAAVNTPVVGLFGPTDPAMYAPYGVRHRALWHPQPCSPCFRQKERRPQCMMECIKSITVEEAEAAALQLLA